MTALLQNLQATADHNQNMEEDLDLAAANVIMVVSASGSKIGIAVFNQLEQSVSAWQQHVKMTRADNSRASKLNPLTA
jgi:hypothetical protein